MGRKRRPRKDPGGEGAKGEEEQRKSRREKGGGRKRLKEAAMKEAEDGSGEWSGQRKRPRKDPGGRR